MNIQDWFPLGWTGLTALLSKGLLRVFSNTTVQKCQFFSAQLSLWSNFHIRTWLLENHSFAYITFVGKVISLLFNMLFRLVITFLPRSKLLLISWLQSPSAVILETKKIKSLTVSIVSPSICHEVMGPNAMILAFWMLSFNFFTLLFHFHQEALQFFFTFCHKGWCHLHTEVIDISPSNLDSRLVFHPARHFSWYNLHIY